VQRKSERRAEVQTEFQNEARLEYQETAVYPRGARYRASDVSSQSTTNDADHYLEILDTSSHSDQEESTGDNDNEEDHYDKPENPYEGLDNSAVVNSQAHPTPSVYDHLTHWLFIWLLPDHRPFSVSVYPSILCCRLHFLPY